MHVTISIGHQSSSLLMAAHQTDQGCSSSKLFLIVQAGGCLCIFLKYFIQPEYLEDLPALA